MTYMYVRVLIVYTCTNKLSLGASVQAVFSTHLYIIDSYRHTYTAYIILNVIYFLLFVIRHWTYTTLYYTCRYVRYVHTCHLLQETA